MNIVKAKMISAVGAAAGVMTYLFGAWNPALTTLVIFMALDYITGIVVAGIFHNSPKSKEGALESGAGWKGIFRKGMTLLVVLIAHRLDLAVGTEFIRDSVIFGYIANETVSIIENAGLMGLPMPPAVKKAIELLRSKESEVQSSESE